MIRRFLLVGAFCALLPILAWAQINPPSVSLSGAGTSANIQLDPSKSPATALLVNFSGGATGTVTVDVAGKSNGPWNPHDTLQNVTVTSNGNLSFPIQFVRLRAISLSGGTVTLTAIQGSH